MTISQIQSFLTLAKILNFTRAANILHITQPTLSKIVTNMEDEIGIPLIYRTKRSVSLTEAGKTILPYFEQIVSTYQDAIETTITASTGMQGVLHIGFSSTLLRDFIPELLDQMKIKYPDIHTSIFDGTQEELIHLLNTDVLDMIFVNDVSHIDEEQFSFQLILRSHLCVFCRRDHPFAKKEYVTAQDLAQEKILIAGRSMLPTETSAVSNYIYSGILSKYGLSHRITNVYRTIQNMLIALDCNHGVTLLPDAFLEQASDKIVAIPFYDDTHDEMILDLYLVWKEASVNIRCIELLLDVVDSIIMEKPL